MSSLVQKLRSQFQKGDEVLVERRRYGDKQTVHRGVILELQESMAVVHFPARKGKSTEVLPYKRLLAVPAEPKKKTAGSEIVLRAVPPAFQHIKPAAKEPAMPEARIVAPPRPQKQLPIAASVQTAARADAEPINPEIVAWMEMGTTLVENLRSRARTLRTQSERLAHEAQRLTDESDCKLEEAEKIEAQLGELEKFSRVVQAALGGKS